jgi:hypothetical protein
MMEMTNHNESNCGFADELVSYLYGDLHAEETGRFESHIGNCTECASEVAGFSSLRVSIGELKTDFEAIPTPPIRIPYPMTASAEPKASVFDSLRTLLSGFRTLAAGSVALVAITAGAIYYLGPSDQGSELAGGNINGTKSTASPTAQPSPPVAEKQLPDQTAPETAATNPKDTVPGKVGDKKTAPRPEVRKSGTQVKKSDKRQSPTIIDETDDEDKTLRLADLFDEIGTE